MFTGASLRFALEHALLPQHCMLCQAPDADAAFCSGCRGDLPQIADACPRCAGPSHGRVVCGACLAHPPNFDATIALWRYEFPIDRLVHALKYAQRLAIAAAFGDALAQVVAEHRVDAIVPMPLGAKRLAERGYNQAVEIARRVTRRIDLVLAPRLVWRVRDTVPQTDLPHDARVVNVRGAFACATDVAGMTLAIVDDVMTTGATLDELAGTLKRAGAQRVVNWVVARTWPH